MTEPVDTPADPPAPLLTPDDLKNFATIATPKAQEMIDDAIGEAAFHAPCLLDPNLTPAKRAFAKSKLRAAVLRWHEAGSGALATKQQSTMSYSQTDTVDTRQPRKGMFYQAEIDQLKLLCRSDEDTGGAFNIDTLPAGGTVHSPVCNSQAWLGGGPCSCGANLTGTPGYPLWETHPDDGWA